MEGATSIWADTVPLLWKPKPIEPRSETPDRAAGKSTRGLLTYADIWIAATFNWHRTVQLYLHETLHDCGRFLQLSGFSIFSDADNITMENSQQTATRLIDDTLSSVPFLVGQVDAYGNQGTNSMVKEVGMYLAFVALKTVQDSPLASEIQKQDANVILNDSVQLWKHGIL